MPDGWLPPSYIISVSVLSTILQQNVCHLGRSTHSLLLLLLA